MTGQGPRPRIHIRPAPSGATWSRHLAGPWAIAQPTPGAALDEALAALQVTSAVVILGGDT